MKKKIVVLILAAALMAALPGAALAKTDAIYTDISGAWYSDAAAQYAYTEIFSSDIGRFYPDRAISRIEFVRLLHRALGITINYFAAPDISDDFSDMQNSDTGAGDLIDLVTAGIVDKGGKFDPEGQLERELMIHWIMNALNYKTGGSYPIPMVKPVPFMDDDQISDSYRGEIYSAVVLKLVYGRGDQRVAPKSAATRAEAVTIVKRLMDLLSSYKAGVDVTASARLDEVGALELSLTIRNGTDKAVAIEHTSGQKYDFKLFDAAGSTLYTWSADKMFAAITGSTILKPGDVIVFSDTLQSAAAAVGSAATMRAYIIGTSNDFPIDQSGYPASIPR